MHAVQGRGRAQTVDLGPDEVWRRIGDFFADRIPRLEHAGIARERLILDPGMGLFLSRRPEASLRVLAGLQELKQAFGLPILVSVSRKSFLARLTGHDNPTELGAATLAAELYAAGHGADFIRTHDPPALRDALIVQEGLTGGYFRVDPGSPPGRRAAGSPACSWSRPPAAAAPSRNRHRRAGGSRPSD
jgi:dihydropteroate synthase type 2